MSCDNRDDGSGSGLVVDTPEGFPFVGLARRVDGRHDCADVGIVAGGCPLDGSGIESIVIDEPRLAVHDGERYGVALPAGEVVGPCPLVADPCADSPVAVGEQEGIAASRCGHHDAGSGVVGGVAEGHQPVLVNGGGCGE